MAYFNKALLLLITINFFTNHSFAQTSKLERDGEPDIYFLDGEDEEMNVAIKNAQNTFDDFLNTFDKKKKNSDLYFSIKVAFETDDGGFEHIWLSDISTRKNRLYGEVGNTPDAVSGLALGDRVKIDKSNISDWMIIEDNKLIGGYTIRVIRDRMSESDRAEFDRQFGAIIE